MSFYYTFTPTTATNITQTPDSEPLDERWDILDDVPTKTSSSFDRCNTFIKYQEYHHDAKSEGDEMMMMNHPYSSLSSDGSPDIISTYFREEMESSEIPKIIVEEIEHDYFDFISEEQENENTSDDEDDDVTDETIPLEQAPPSLCPSEDDKYTVPTNLLEYHQNLVNYYKSCLMKQTSGNELVESIHNLSIL